MEKRDYPSAVNVHRPGCPDLSPLLISRPSVDVAREYPNGRPHHCFSPGHDPRAVVEQMEYPPHAYEASTLLPSDAVRPLCSYCRGTHGVLDTLILPEGTR